MCEEQVASHSNNSNHFDGIWVVEIFSPQNHEQKKTLEKPRCRVILSYPEKFQVPRLKSESWS